MRITLEISAGPEAGRRLWLGNGQSIIVGRTERAEFTVPSDLQMSSVHFQVAWLNGGFRLRDLKSTNGTTLNGERIQDADLKAGDVVVAGKTKFVISLEIDSLPPTDSSVPETRSSPQPPELRRPFPPATETNVGLPTLDQLPNLLPVPQTSSIRGTLVFDEPVRLADEPRPEPDEVENEPAELLVVNNQTPFSVVCLPWQNAEGAGRLTVIVKATFRFTEAGIRIAEKQLPIWFADQHEEDDPLKSVRFEADTAPFKPRTDVVLVGKAYAPGGRPRTSLDVRLRVGGLNKRLRVFGDRRWLFPTRLAVVPQITDPEPFAEMPLSYTRAYGGIDESAARYCAENLMGIGFIGEPAPASIHNKPLPNIEDPDHLIKSWDTRPKPVGFGFFSRSCQPRLRYAGTYDDAYRRTRAPRPPEDFSHEVHNGAHPDLQVAGYLDGDELVELENVCRDGNFKFALPGVSPRIALTRYVTTEGRLSKKLERPVKPFLDTLVFVPDEHLVYAIFRAVFVLRDIDEPDIAEVRIE